jgi:microcystin-dependent protein
MPSTYNNNLRLEMIATGEQSGTWGQTTNNNLGTLLVAAITGKTSITSSSSPYTLTALDGTADESRAAALELNCTGANFQVIVPTVTKLYVVENVNGTDSVTVKTASGSGVTVPPLKSVLVRCDGTNIVEQLDYIAGTFEVNGATTINGAATFGSTVTLDADPTLALQAATKQYVDNASAGSSPSGSLIMWPTGSAPSGWLLCDGAAVSRTTYAALFAVIGTTFGAGDTTTTFNLPDYRDRMPIGANTIAASVGATGGSKDAIVVSHTHTASVSDPGHTHRVRRTGNTTGASSITKLGLSTSFVTDNDLIEASVTGISVSNSTEGSSGTNANMPPYLGINFIIKT